MGKVFVCRLSMIKEMIDYKDISTKLREQRKIFISDLYVPGNKLIIASSTGLNRYQEIITKTNFRMVSLNKEIGLKFLRNNRGIIIDSKDLIADDLRYVRGYILENNNSLYADCFVEYVANANDKMEELLANIDNRRVKVRKKIRD